MNSTCSHVQDDWELYALGGLPEDTQQAMAAHLESGCGNCRQRYFEAQTALTAMSTLAPTLRPSAAVERKLMQAIKGEKSPALPGWTLWKSVPWAAAFACLLLLLWLAQDRARLQSELAASRSTAQQAQRDETALEERLEAVRTAAQNPAPQQNAHVANAPASAPGDSIKVQSQLAEALRQAQISAAEKSALQQQIAKLQSDIAIAGARATALENELSFAQLQARQAQQGLQEKDRAARAASDETAQLAEQLAQSRAEVRRLASAAGENGKIERLLQSAALQEVSLRGVIPQAGHATARALYSPQGGLLLLADSLPPLPDHKCYQLWLIRRASPAIVSGGLVTLQSDGKGILFAPPSADLAEVSGLAITDEPAGGSPSSRGKKLLFGSAN
jgi:hypothetical protein